LLGLRKPISAQPAPAGPIPWGDVDVRALPGVIFGTELPQVIAEIENLLQIPQRTIETLNANPARKSLPVVEGMLEQRPRRVGTLDEYSIVEYEGWFYGLPKTLGEIDLREVDVLETPGVIRDLSREVVEGEIRELRAMTL